MTLFSRRLTELRDQTASCFASDLAAKMSPDKEISTTEVQSNSNREQPVKCIVLQE